jgi:NAD(P)-dependent dehydrogenase (short-subunit alcohol dehydrogenase family)
MSDLAGKTVLITGASGNLGEPVVLAFQAAGAFVAGTARQLTALQHVHLPIAADLSTRAGVQQAIGAVLDARGSLDVLVHLMGGFAADGPVGSTSEDTWDRMMSLNARSAFLLFRETVPHLVQAGKGRVIAVGSRAGIDCPGGLSAYAASKAALHALVQSVANETRHKGVTVNAVLPSTIDTAANRAAMPSADPAKWVAPASIASLLVWLASDESRDVNGALIPIYGRS